MTKRDGEGAYASSPCFAHELQFTEEGYQVVDPEQARDVARWRKAERERLIAARLEVPADERKRIADEVAAELDALVEPRPGLIVSVYWPFRGELDLRGWMRAATERGHRIALPIVRAKGQPLYFREWHPGCRMERGVWNIPVPAETAELTPDVAIAPLIGFDDGCYRLGYGGGFYDRTLAALSPRPRVIGVGLPQARIPTIYPQPHDIPMDVIVTGAGQVVRRARRRAMTWPDSLGRLLVEGMPDALLVADADGVIRFWNGGAERIFGFTADEAIGQSLDLIIPGNLRARHWSAYHETMETGRSRYAAGDLLSVPAATRDRRRISVQFSILPIPSAHGGLRGVAAIMRDVTAEFEERKRLRNQLQPRGPEDAGRRDIG